MKLDDELVDNVELYIPRHVLFHGYIFPFVFIYSWWLWCWISIYGWEEFFEYGLIVIALLGCLQILTCLFCHWSVHVKCALTCKKVSSLFFT